MRCETRLVTLLVTLNRIGQDPATRTTAVGFSGEAIIKRSDFGLNTALKLVADEIHIRLEILAMAI